MKKIYLLVGALFGSMFGIAQNVANDGPTDAITNAPSIRDNAPVHRDRGTPYFYEDFANGLAGNNAIGAWTTSGADGAVWTYDTDGSDGQYWGSRSPIQSTSASNGWMIFDADGFNTPGTPSTFQNLEGQLVSPVIDLSTAPTVSVEFEHYFRWCCYSTHELYLEVSTDGGATFPNQISLKGGFSTNDDSYTVFRSVNITPIAAGQSQVVIRFNWAGSSTASHYFWMIDDVALAPTAPDELSLLTSRFGGATPDPVWGDHLNYHTIGTDQIDPNGYLFLGTAVNDGGNAQTNASIDASITGASAGNTVVNGQFPMATIASLDTLRDTTATYMPAASIDQFMAQAYVTYDNGATDLIPSNDTMDFSFEVVPAGRYGRSPMFQTSATSNGTDQGTGNGNAYMLGPMIVPNATVTIGAISVVFDDLTDANALCYPVIIEMDPNAADFQSLFASTIYDGSANNGDYTIQASDISPDNQTTTWVDIVLENTVTMNAGSAYVVAIGYYGGPERVVIGASNAYDAPDATNFIFDVPGVNGNTQWYWMTSQPMIHIVDNANIGVGIDEVAMEGISLEQNRPNPFNGTTQISYSLENSADVAIDIVDVTGKQVMTLDEGTRVAGEYQLTVDASNFAPGVYYYTLRAGEKSMTKKMMITK